MREFWRSRETWSYAGLFFLAAVYCNRFYGQDFAFEGDAPIHVYFLLHHKLVWLGYNPFQWDYFVSTSLNGLFNPVLQFFHLVLKPLFSDAEQVERALFTCMLTSWALLGGVSSSVFWFLRKWGRSRWAAALGAVIVSYAGFHQVAVREFDHMYLVSLIAVPPVLDLSYRVLRGQLEPLLGLGWLSLWLGFSFLGGTSSPLFYYLSAMPLGMAILFRRERLSARQMAVRTLILLAAGVWGVCIAAPVLFPSIQFMHETNRAVQDRFGPGLTLRFFLRTVFLRDWWNAQGHYQEWDVFVGLPVLVLFLGAISARLRKGAAQVMPFAGTFLLFGIVVILNGLLPKPLPQILAAYFNSLSIAGAPRFLILCLLPIAAWAGWALDDRQSKPYWRMGALLLAVQLFYLWNYYLYPPPGLPDLRVAMLWSLACAGAATLLVFLRGAIRGAWVPGAITLLVFFMYFFAPVQLTYYNDWYERYGLDKEVSPNRLSLDRLLGFHFEYATAANYARASMLNVPALLSDPATREGRIFINGTSGLRGRYHAPLTGHRYAFESARDPATPVRVFELIDLKFAGVLDIYQVKWMLDLKRGREKFERGVTPAYTELENEYHLVPRPSGLPEFFLAGGFSAMPNREAVLAQMKVRKGDVYRGSALVDCSEMKCEDLQSWIVKGDYPSAPERSMRFETKEPGRIVLQVEAGAPAVLSIGLPYHPAWIARDLEGNRELRPLVRANHAFMALPLGPGAASIELTFDLKIRRWSLAFGLMAILAAIGLVFWRGSRNAVARSSVHGQN